MVAVRSISSGGVRAGSLDAATLDAIMPNGASWNPLLSSVAGGSDGTLAGKPGKGLCGLCVGTP